MKTVLLYACAIFFMSCQKEVLMPAVPAEGPPAQPKPAPEPEPEPVSESVYLSNLYLVLNSKMHYKLEKQYSDDADLWETVPVWVKDDVHTFIETGDGLIESKGESCPADPFTNKSQRWIAYAGDDGVKLDWVDNEYKPVTYIMVSAIAGKSFKAYQIKNEIKIYSEFVHVEK